MHSALRPLLWGWCAGLTDAINKVIHYNFLLFYLNYTTRLVLSHSAHQHWFCIASMQLEAAHKNPPILRILRIVWLKQQLWSGIFHCFVALDIWYLTLLLFPILIAVITLRFHILGRLYISVCWAAASFGVPRVLISVCPINNSHPVTEEWQGLQLIAPSWIYPRFQIKFSSWIDLRFQMYAHLH